MIEELEALPEGEPIPEVARNETIEILIDARTMRPRKVLAVIEARMDGKVLRRTQSRWAFDWAGTEPR